MKYGSAALAFITLLGASTFLPGLISAICVIVAVIVVILAINN